MGPIGSSIVLTFLLLGGCASIGCQTSVGTVGLTPAAVAAEGGHLGELVQWGGTLAEVRHREDSTELEVVSYPLESCGRPRTKHLQTGRFIILRPGFLETADYQIGQRVGATGRITGIREGRVGDAPYSFPLLESYKIRSWPEEQQTGEGYSRPWVNIGIGGGSGGVYGGVGVIF